jgi:predicted nucleotidyltransferase component of viral defense system
MTEPSRNRAQSVHQRLLNKARQRNEDPNLVLIRYALERFLYRLGRSVHKDQFILKGAMLFAAWTDQLRRPTRNLDLLGIGDSSDEALVRLIGGIIRTPVEPDGLDFDCDGITISEIREAQDYPGKRIKLPVRLGNARLNLQIDVGFGDAVTPEPAEISYPTLLDSPPPRIRAYPLEAMIAEKLQALVAFDMAISRMKDFYDVWMLSKQFSFDGVSLSAAIAATFERRRTTIPDGDRRPLLTNSPATVASRCNGRPF